MKISPAFVHTGACLTTLVALTTWTDSAAAADKWDREPTAVLGLPLGQSFPSSIPDCESPADRSLCVYKRFGAQTIQLLGLPFRDMRISAFVQLRDGKIETLEFDLAHDDYARFEQILRDRYGLPTSVGRTVVTAVGGAEVENRVEKWIGEKVTITSVERSGTLDDSLVVVRDIALVSESNADARQRDLDSSSKL